MPKKKDAKKKILIKIVEVTEEEKIKAIIESAVAGNSKANIGGLLIGEEKKAEESGDYSTLTKLIDALQPYVFSPPPPHHGELERRWVANRFADPSFLRARAEKTSSNPSFVSVLSAERANLADRERIVGKIVGIIEPILFKRFGGSMIATRKMMKDALLTFGSTNIELYLLKERISEPEYRDRFISMVLELINERKVTEPSSIKAATEEFNNILREKLLIKLEELVSSELENLLGADHPQLATYILDVCTDVKKRSGEVGKLIEVFKNFVILRQEIILNLACTGELDKFKISEDKIEKQKTIQWKLPTIKCNKEDLYKEIKDFIEQSEQDCKTMMESKYPEYVSELGSHLGSLVKQNLELLSESAAPGIAAGGAGGAAGAAAAYSHPPCGSHTQSYLASPLLNMSYGRFK